VRSALLVLYAAFLWWVAVRALQAGLMLVGSGMYFGLLFNGASGATLLGLLGILEALCVVILWIGIAAALRPGALAPSPLARNGAVLLGAVLTLLGSQVLFTWMAAARTALSARELGVEGLALLAQGQAWLGVGSQLLHVLTWLVVLTYLWWRVREP
jgi:hypothetical protein